MITTVNLDQNVFVSIDELKSQIKEISLLRKSEEVTGCLQFCILFVLSRLTFVYQCCSEMLITFYSLQ